MTQPIVFISYSFKDEAEKDELLSHLGVLDTAGLVTLWSDASIQAGSDLQAEIDRAIAQAEIAVLLITADFLNSRFILDSVMPVLLNRRQNEALAILPIIARACAWRAVEWLRQMNIKPKNGVPVWSNGGIHVDEELSLIAEEIVLLVESKKASLAHATTTEGFAEIPVIDQSPDPASEPVRAWQILVVDDEPSWQRRLARIFREIECAVVTAENFEQAEKLLTDFSFDLVTIDLNLDKSTRYADGLELIRQFRETFGHRTPVVIVTGTGSLEEQRRAFKEYNVTDFIQKAKLDLEEFQNIVIEAVGSTHDRL